MISPDPLTVGALIVLFGLRPALGLLERRRTEASSITRRLSWVALMALVAAVAGWRLAISPAEIGLVIKAPARTVAVIIFGVIILIGADTFGAFLLQRRPELLQARTAALSAWLGNTTTWPLLLYICLAASYEEAVFRGLGLVISSDIDLPLAVAISGSAVVFGLNHTAGGWIGVICAMWFGFAYSLIFIVSGSLLAPIAVHVAGNAYTLLWIYPRMVKSLNERAAPAYMF